MFVKVIGVNKKSNFEKVLFEKLDMEQSKGHKGVIDDMLTWGWDEIRVEIIKDEEEGE